MKQLKLLFLTTTFLFSSFTFVAEGGISASKSIKAEKNNPAASATASAALPPETVVSSVASGLSSSSAVAPTAAADVGGGGGGSKEGGAAGEEDTCPLCIEKPKKPAKISPCGHIFCLECLEMVAKTFKQCPLCRRELREIIQIPVQQGGEAASKIEVSVKAVGMGVTIAQGFDVDSNHTVASLRKAIFSVGILRFFCGSLGIRLFLGHGGTELSDNNVTLRDAGVEDGSTIVVVRITPELYLAQQRTVMAKIYDLLPDGAIKDGALARLNGDPGNWVGVTEVSEEGFILKLSLSHNQLTGAIPPELGQLTKLRTLFLPGNQLTGAIPGELGLLTKLESLDLSWNRLTGPIPGELGQLTKLKTLWLSDNKLTGPIPRELGLLTQLKWLSLSFNRLTGLIPPELGQLTELKILKLSDNKLTGEIPTQLGQLTKLIVLNLHENQLTGPIPRELGQLTKLQKLSLFSNKLTGAIPTELGLLTTLQVLSLSENQLTGPTPPELIREGLTVFR